MKYGYLRVSTKEQNEARQIAELIKYVDIKNIFIDKSSGRNFERPSYIELKEKVENGDQVYFKELDRLGRSKKDMKEELEYFRKKNVIVRILDIPTTLMDFKEFGELQKSIMDMVNTILIEVLSTQAETELKKIKQRQKEGIAIAKEKGKYTNCGRKSLTKIDKNFILLYEQWKKEKISIVGFAKMLNCSRTTVYKKIKEYEIQNMNSN